MRGWRVLVIAVAVLGCRPPQHPRAPEPGPAESDAADAAAAPAAAAPAPPPVAVEAHPGGGAGPGPIGVTPVAAPAATTAASPAGQAGKLVDQSSEFVFDGGRIDFETRQVGKHVIQLARNRYAVPIVMQWSASGVNVTATGPTDGVVVLPAAAKPNGDGKAVELVAFTVRDGHHSIHVEHAFHARFGDPAARPSEYIYALPFGKKQSFAVLQGFHGAFSHRGSNEFAIDFDCPVATTVLAARAGVVVAANESAQGSGTTAEFLDFHRVNFVIVLHDDGTLGEYMHLSPSGVIVEPGQRVVRGQPLALSGNTGFSSTPHLHFQVMTAGDDGITAQSFPFELASAARRVEEPVQGRTYTAWE